jgi:hypothetical protein
MIAHSRTLACPSFASWLQVAAFTGMRPGELDALRCGHRYKGRALDRIVGAYATRAESRRTRSGSSSGASHTLPQEKPVLKHRPSLDYV